MQEDMGLSKAQGAELGSGDGIDAEMGQRWIQGQLVAGWR